MAIGTDSTPDGLAVSDVIRPTSADDIAATLREASARGEAVLPFGGGTALVTGNAVDEPFLGMDLRGLSGVREYTPEDLTVSFHAGTSLAEVRDTLEAHGQELPMDLPQAAQGTIGGLVATGYSGPRRLGAGTLKDLLIGCGYVRGDGLVAKAGGMLVKNVSGYEMTRLLHGSWGALAVLTSVNLKVVPKPKADTTFVSRVGTLSEAIQAQSRALAGHPLAQASVILRQNDGWAVRLRLTGRERALQAQDASVRDDLGGDVATEQGGDGWVGLADSWAASDGMVRVTVGAAPDRLQGHAEALCALDGVTGALLSIPTGGARLRIDPKRIDRAELEARLSELDGVTWVIEDAPPSWKGSGSVWGPATPARAVMRSIKAEFDPAGVLNRGRLVV